MLTHFQKQNAKLWYQSFKIYVLYLKKEKSHVTKKWLWNFSGATDSIKISFKVSEPKWTLTLSSICNIKCINPNTRWGNHAQNSQNIFPLTPSNASH